MKSALADRVEGLVCASCYSSHYFLALIDLYDFARWCYQGNPRTKPDFVPDVMRPKDGILVLIYDRSADLTVLYVLQFAF